MKEDDGLGLASVTGLVFVVHLVFYSSEATSEHLKF
jgi:hypothetical protein